MTESAPAGWYPDAQNNQMERYWDGTAWTERTRVALPEVASEPSVAPGWYPDAQDGTLERYWDGSAWTEHTQPVARAGVPESWAVASTAVASGIAPGWYGDPQNAQMERYWDGTAWTEHTRALADSGGGAPTMPVARTEARSRQTVRGCTPLFLLYSFSSLPSHSLRRKAPGHQELQ
jgi:hypothetical protein